MNNKKSKFIEPELTVSELSRALYKANQQLSDTNQKLIEAKRERDEIFANISHDLRSPITAIRNTLELIKSSENMSKEELNKMLELIDKRSHYLEDLINDVFLLSSLDIKKEIHPEKLNIGMFLEEFYFTTETDNKFAKRELILDVPQDFPHDVNIDPNLFLRVLDNLFSNALKYSNDNASITLGVTLKNASTVQIYIKDTGIGMAKEHLEHIFERTYRIDEARTPGSSGGCGLGLAIVKSIVDMHKGEIYCESTIGKGSTFYIELPTV